MTLKRISIVVDADLWGETWDEQTNALEQGLINARGHPDLYPIIFSEFERPAPAVAKEG